MILTVSATSVTVISTYAFYDCNGVSAVYYKGNSDEWSDSVLGADSFSSYEITVYYYSKNAPVADGNFWHYDENNNVEIW